MSGSIINLGKRTFHVYILELLLNKMLGLEQKPVRGERVEPHKNPSTSSGRTVKRLIEQQLYLLDFIDGVHLQGSLHLFRHQPQNVEASLKVDSTQEL